MTNPENFVLSDKRLRLTTISRQRGSNTIEPCYKETDVKEFIKKLKEDIMKADRYGFHKWEDMFQIIDKLAGEGLK